MSHTKIEYGCTTDLYGDVDIDICEECSEGRLTVVEWPCQKAAQ